jgi:surface antigen-like variable number repeat protein
MKNPHRNCRLALATMLLAAGLGAGALAADDPPTPAPLRAAVLGAPGVPGAGPVIDQIDFTGNSRVAATELGAVVSLPVGTPLSAAVIQEQLDRISAYYEGRGGAYVQPSILETALNHVHVIFQVHEGVRAMEEPDAAPAPAFLEKYFGNTLVCAAAQTSNDLCHMWLNRDGTFIIFDPNGAHTGHWRAGKVRADGRVPICRYWDLSAFVLPAELQSRAGGPPPSAAGAKPMTRICETHNFRTTCTAYQDVGQLSPELQRKARLTMIESRHEDGICYAHGPHEVGDVWFEWDDPLPGQIGLDREMLLPGQQ